MTQEKVKAYTDLKQSKKLAEILPLESADMCWFEGEPFVEAVTGYEEERAESHRQAGMEMYPCWSLAALLAILPFPVLYMEMLGGMILWSCECHFMETNEVVKIEHYNNPIDACYEMIIRLNELNLL